MASALALTATVTLLAGAGGAAAGSLVTSRQIADNTVRSADVKDGGLTLRDVRSSVRRDLADAETLGGQDPSAFSTRRDPLTVLTATEPSRTITMGVRDVVHTVLAQEVTTPDACGEGRTSQTYLLQATNWAGYSFVSGNGATVRTSLTVDSTGLSYGPGFMLTALTGGAEHVYTSMASSRVVQVPSGTHTFRLLADFVNGPAGAQLQVGDPVLTVSDLGYECVDAPATSPSIAPRGQGPSGR